MAPKTSELDKVPNGTRHPAVVLIWIDEFLLVGETDFVRKHVVAELHTEIHLGILDDFTHMPAQALAKRICKKAILDANLLANGDPAINLEHRVSLDVVVMNNTVGCCRGSRGCNNGAAC